MATRPDAIVRLLAFSAILVFINLIGVKFGDRYGREFNPNVNLWMTTSDAARIVVAPLVVLIVFVATNSSDPPIAVPTKVREK